MVVGGPFLSSRFIDALCLTGWLPRFAVSKVQTDQVGPDRVGLD